MSFENAETENEHVLTACMAGLASAFCRKIATPSRMEIWKFSQALGALLAGDDISNYLAAKSFNNLLQTD